MFEQFPFVEVDPEAGANFTAAPGFHEGSAWNYTFYVPHDVEGLARLMGGRRKFVEKLQTVFDKGLYDPANEPDIAYAYLFSRFPGEEWRTQREVARLLGEYFTTQPDGIPGNDDTGTMSAWAVFSMMGLYPDCPGEPYYTLTAPTFDRVEIDTPRGELVQHFVADGHGGTSLFSVQSPLFGAGSPFPRHSRGKKCSCRKDWFYCTAISRRRKGV